MSNETQVVTLSEAALERIVSGAAASAAAAAIEAANKPKPLTESQQAELVQEQEMRREIAQTALAKERNQQALQKVCLHKHKKTGQSKAVLIRDLDYYLCQQCGIQVKAGKKPESDKSNRFTYDTALYNRMAMEAED
jgi:hypothetical protein